MTALPYPDEEALTRDLSIDALCELWSDMRGDTEGKPPPAYLRATLAGRISTPDGSSFQRLTVDPLRNSLFDPSSPDVTYSWDVDSVIGQSFDLPFVVPQAFFFIPSFKDTMTDSVHLMYKLDIPEFQKRPLHRISNMALCTGDRRHKTLVCFPRMQEGTDVPQTLGIPKDMGSLVYDILRESFLEVSPMDRSRIPPTIGHAFQLYRDVRGRLHHGSFDLPPSSLAQFVKLVMKRFSSHPRLTDAFFLHEVRGVKGSTHHDPRLGHKSREEAVSCALRIFRQDSLIQEHWYLDFALEVMQEGRLLQWITSGHSRILGEILPESASKEENARVTAKLVQNKNRFRLDISAQLKGVGGFRVDLGRKKDGGLAYLTLYTTDKSATYQLHQGLYRRRAAWHLFPQYAPKLLQDMEHMEKTFMDHASLASPGNARLELRAPLSQATSVLMVLPNVAWNLCIASFEPQTWWGFKAHRMFALRSVLADITSGPYPERCMVSSLSLGAMGVYMLNALNRRPGEGSGETALLCASSHHISSPMGTDAPTQPTLYDDGLFFISDITKETGLGDGVQESYHLPVVRSLDPNKLATGMYRRDCYQHVKDEMRPKELMPVEPAPQRIRGPALDRAPGLTQPTFPPQSDSEVLGFLQSLPDLEYDKDGLDDAEESSHLDKEVGEEEANPLPPVEILSIHNSRSGPNDGISDIDLHQLCLIVRHFPNDILRPLDKAEEGKTIASFTLDPNAFNISVLQERDLLRIFPNVFVQKRSLEKWMLLLYTYFPTSAEGCTQLVTRQGFKSAEYIRLWTDLMQRNGWRGFSGISNEELLLRNMFIRAIWAWFKELHWLPIPQSDRMWRSSLKVVKGFQLLQPIVGGESVLLYRIATQETPPGDNNQLEDGLARLRISAEEPLEAP